MPVRADYALLSRMIQLSLSERSRSVFSTVKYDFTDKGVFVRQVDPSRIVMVMLEIEPDYFYEYDAIGEVVVQPKELLSVLADHFKREGFVELSVETVKDSKYIVLKSENALYRNVMYMHEEVPSEAEPKQYQGIPYIESDNYRLRYVFEADVSSLKAVKKKWETVWFTATPKGMEYEIEYGVGGVTKRLPVTVRHSESGYENRVSFGIAAEHLSLIASALPGRATIAVVADDKGEPGPVTFHSKQQNLEQAYIYVPSVRE